ncbi:MAG TPA: phosphoenolpyruvate synthase [Chitinophagaceae bacterium]|nr:phosphoenolpyruvate synthase [Chitinophagaceae bacterium]
MKKYIKVFSETGISDVPLVGGKNASLGEMISRLSGKGIPVPDGFSVTALGFQHFLSVNGLHEKLHEILSQLDKETYRNLKETGKAARELFRSGTLPEDLVSEIRASYRELSGANPIAVAVRSSATAEDLPHASFAGQHESYLNVRGEEALLAAVHRCFASLYTDRAIKYREDNGFEHTKVSLSVGVQHMVRADTGSSGVCFTLEPESGFRDVIHISGVWGLGENIVQGTVTPDEFYVFKPTLAKGFYALLQKKLGEKEYLMQYGDDPGTPVKNIETPQDLREQFVLTDAEVQDLAKWALEIESHYQRPMDIEWAKDGETGKLYIIQARPETVHSQVNPLHVTEYHIKDKGKCLARGEAIGRKVVTGKARLLSSPAESGKLQAGDIVVTDLTSPDWDPILKLAGGIITNKGGRTSHASIVARELGVPAVVGCGNATESIRDGVPITVSCSEGKTGFVYEGHVPFTETDIDFSSIQKPACTKVMLIAGDPDKAYTLSFYPNDGVGLMRLEFIITHAVQVHPMALIRYDAVTDQEAKNTIDKLARNYPDRATYFVDKLAQGVATIAAAFYPKVVIVRMSDFKSNEYANLVGGRDFEPKEENPMIGFRGASRYYHELYREGFRLECEAIRKVRDQMGLSNVKVMIPFCRTVEEGRKVIAQMKAFGLEQSVNGLEVYVMAEIPSNVVLAEQFAELFDGFSIGSNDLTQLTLGIDRDSALVSNLFSEQNDAAMYMIATVIQKARAAGKKIGLCGQAPSDFPEFAAFLVQQGIHSISFNPDALLKGIEHIVQAERETIPASAKHAHSGLS